MTETTQAERNAVQEWAANHSPIRLSANLATRLKEDADRLARAEELLSKARNQIDNPNPLSTLDERIDAFLSEK